MIKLFLKKELWKQHCRKVFLFLFVTCCIFSALYLYFMNLTVLKTAEHNINLIKLTEIKEKTQTFESAYITKLEELNINNANLLGFIEAEPSRYVYKEKSVAQGDGYGQSFR